MLHGWTTQGRLVQQKKGFTSFTPQPDTPTLTKGDRFAGLFNQVCPLHHASNASHQTSKRRRLLTLSRLSRLNSTASQ